MEEIYMSKGWTMNCDELFELLKQKAPTKESCMTKSELRVEAESKLSGIGGSRINACLEQLQGVGKVKQSVKCVQTCDCYYDPPTSTDRTAFDWRPAGLFIAVAGLAILIWQASKRPSGACNPCEKYVPMHYVVTETLPK
jgi:hypothetical protein